MAVLCYGKRLGMCSALLMSFIRVLAKYLLAEKTLDGPENQIVLLRSTKEGFSLGGGERGEFSF